MKTGIFPILACFVIILSSCTAVSQSPTSTPTETLMPTATQTTTPVPGGPCDNPLVPLVPGNLWEYQVTSDGTVYEFDLVVGDRSDIGNININVDLVDRTFNNRVKELVVCKQGAIDNFPLYVLNMLLTQYRSSLLSAYLDYNSVSYSPAFSAFSSNNWVLTWEPLYHVEETMSIFYPVVQADLSPLVGGDIQLTFNSTGIFEEVTVPGGTFLQALKVFNDITIPGSMDVAGTSQGGDLVIKTTQWYVPFLGLVRAQVDSAVIVTTGGATMPFPLTSVLEMKAFLPGPVQ